MQTTFNLALNIVLKLNFLNTIFFMNFTGQILLKTKKDNSISRNILYSRVVTLMSFSFCLTWKCTQIHQKKPWWCLNMNLLMNCLFWGVQIDGFARHWKCVLSNQWPHYSISSCTMKNFDVAQSYERYTWSLVQYNHANHENERAHQWNCRLDYWLCLETFNVNCN